MANTPVEAVYKALQDQFTIVKYPYVFEEQSVPYYYMYEVNDPRLKQFLCDSRGGQSRITIGRIDTSFTDCVDQLESMASFIETLIGEYSPIEIYDSSISDSRDLTGLEQSQNKVYRREFDVIVTWGDQS